MQALQTPLLLAAGDLRSRCAPLQAPWPLAAGALAKMGFIKESRGPEGHYSVLWGQAS